jgi:hypothetical protein
MAVPVCRAQFAFQTWNGEMFETKTISEDDQFVLAEYLSHKKVMPNCPARLVTLKVVMQTNGSRLDGSYDPQVRIRV